jgi:hypothetical protein
VGQHSYLTSVTVMADITTEVDVYSFAVVVGSGANTDNIADAENVPTVQASIGADATLETFANTLVEAISNATQSTVNMTGVVAGGITVGVSLADATVSPIVKASIGDGADVVALLGNITVSALETTLNGALAKVSASAGSLINGDGANVTATASADVSATVGNGATLESENTVSVNAWDDDKAVDNASSVGVGALLNIGAIFATSTASGSVSATVGDNSKSGQDIVGTASIPIGSLQISVNGTDTSTATVDLSGGGIFNGDGGVATSVSSPIFNAALEAASVDATGGVSVTASSHTYATPTTTEANGGIVDVAASTGNATLSPTTTTENYDATILAGSLTQISNSNANTTATGIGSGGGLVAIGDVTSNLTADPVVSARTGEGTQITTSGDVTINSTSNLTAASVATNNIGGGYAQGTGMATINTDNSTELFLLGGTGITAQGIVNILATSTNTVTGTTNSYGSSFIGSGDAYVTANLGYQTLTEAGQGTSIVAGNGLDIGSTTTTSGMVTAYADGEDGALGGSYNSSADLFMGSANDDSQPDLTQTAIGLAVSLKARTVDLTAATIFGNTSTSIADTAYGLEGGASAAAYADANESSNVVIATGATITGTVMVEIDATNTNTVDIATPTTYLNAIGAKSSYGETKIFGPSQFNSGEPDLSEVDAAAGATITTPALLVQALATFTTVQTSDMAFGVFGANSSHYLGTIQANRTIHWNANVVSLGSADETYLHVCRIHRFDGREHHALGLQPRPDRRRLCDGRRFKDHR